MAEIELTHEDNSLGKRIANILKIFKKVATEAFFPNTKHDFGDSLLFRKMTCIRSKESHWKNYICLFLDMLNMRIYFSSPP